jgi:hypothetical protein
MWPLPMQPTTGRSFFDGGRWARARAVLNKQGDNTPAAAREADCCKKRRRLWADRDMEQLLVGEEGGQGENADFAPLYHPPPRISTTA